MSDQTAPTPKPRRPVQTLVEALRSYEEFGRLTPETQAELDALLDDENDDEPDHDPTVTLTDAERADLAERYGTYEPIDGPTADNPDTTDDKTGETP